MFQPKDPFVYQKPTEEQVAAIEYLRQTCQALNAWLKNAKMDPRYKALAITKLEEVSMWGNKGIVFYDDLSNFAGVQVGRATPAPSPTHGDGSRDTSNQPN